MAVNGSTEGLGERQATRRALGEEKTKKTPGSSPILSDGERSNRGQYGDTTVEPRSLPTISWAAATRGLSEARLTAYRTHPAEPFEVVLGRYRWNAELSMALYPALGLLEVTLRNTLHRAVAGLHGTDAWYDLGPGVLAEWEQKSVALAKDELRKQRKPDEPGRVVAELNLGFWVSLLSTNYEQRLWPKLLKTAFPYLPRSTRTRATVAGRFQEIRRLRNRVSHHEPIYKSKSLAQQYDNIEEAIGWMVPSLLTLLPIGEGFETIFARGPVALKG